MQVRRLFDTAEVTPTIEILRMVSTYPKRYDAEIVECRDQISFPRHGDERPSVQHIHP
jgi:hypothetical protein